MQFAGAAHQFTVRGHQDRGVEPQSVIAWCALVQRGVHEDAVLTGRGGGQGERRAARQILGQGRGVCATRLICGVAQQRDLGQEHRLSALCGRRGDA